jgi:hypothetical protein
MFNHAKDMDKGSPANQNYNEVNVQDLQDMGKVKKNKKGKYVVNENPKTEKDTLYIPKNTKSYTGKKIKVGEMIDESDYEDISRKVNNPVNRNKFGGTPDNTDKQAAYEKAQDQLFAEGKITETNDKAVRLIKKRVKKNAKKLSK